ncbi:MAG: helix-turn-helix transcriptional regulator, partial [Butyricicoccus sp.]|nr:helix-turn-helix transcriptional regulator [Butyricicoccus sp.]
RAQPTLTEDRETVNEHFGFSFMSGAYYAAVCKVDVVLNCVGQVKTDFVCDRIIDMVQETFTGLQCELDCYAEGSTVTVILNTQSTAPHDLLRELLGLLHLYADTFECYRISLSISDAVSDIAELPIAVRQAHALIGNRLFQGNRQLLLSNIRPLISEESAEQLFPLPTRNLMRREIEAFHISVFRTQVLELFSRLNHNPACSAAAYYRLSRLITGFVFQIISENVWDEQTVQQERALLEAHIQNAGSRVELAEMLAERLGALLIQCEEARRNSESRPIRSAREYIAAHYGDALTLEEVAEKAGLSPSYFSLLFKRELGVSFSDYLVELRIKAARELLEETDETIACVAEHVGYRDVKYFSRLFQRMVGVNPSKYRKLHS